ncbi:MAG: (2Fe-2S) ferredoxin domain-containing protein [Planctomycetota bacterium]
METRLVYVCDGGDCNERGSSNLYHRMRTWFEERDPHEERVKVRRYPCFGGCEFGPNITVWPDRIFYSQVKVDDLDDIIRHIEGEGEPVKRLCGKVKPDVEEFLWQMLDSPY